MDPSRNFGKLCAKQTTIIFYPNKQDAKLNLHSFDEPCQHCHGIFGIQVCGRKSKLGMMNFEPIENKIHWMNKPSTQYQKSDESNNSGLPAFVYV